MSRYQVTIVVNVLAENENTAIGEAFALIEEDPNYFVASVEARERD